MKTNKAYMKRLKVTRTGKLVARKPGHNHFNARGNGQKNLRKGRKQLFHMTAKSRSRFIV